MSRNKELIMYLTFPFTATGVIVWMLIISSLLIGKEEGQYSQNELGWDARCETQLWYYGSGFIKEMSLEDVAQYCSGE